MTRLLDRYLSGNDSISYTNINSSHIGDPMLLLLLLQQITGMLACCMYKSRQNTNDIEDFSILSRNVNNQKTEQFMCRICMQAFKNMNRCVNGLLFCIHVSILLLHYSDSMKKHMHVILLDIRVIC